jgi:NADPH:quinone reductase
MPLLAAWYERPGPAGEVLQVGEMADTEPRHGEVRGRLLRHADLDAAVAAPYGVIAAYATRRDRPDFPFWPMLFANLTIRLLGSDDFPQEAKRQAANDLNAAAREGALSIPIGELLPLHRIAEAHERIDAGARQRVLLSIP